LILSSLFLHAKLLIILIAQGMTTREDMSALMVTDIAADKAIVIVEIAMIAYKSLPTINHVMD
jgi:hypothetical protein